MFYYPETGSCMEKCLSPNIQNFDYHYKTCIPGTTMQEVLGASQTTTQAVTQITSVLSSGSPGISASIAGKIFSNIKYLNITYSNELEDALKTWGSNFLSLGVSPDIPEGIKGKVEEEPIPYMFEKHEVSSSFLLNFWDEVGLLVVLSGVCAILKLFSWIASKIQKIKKYLRIFVSLEVMSQNFLFTQFYGLAGDLILFASLEYRKVRFNNSVDIVSILLSLMLIIIMVVCFAWNLHLAFEYKRIKRCRRNSKKLLNEFLNNHKGSHVLFGEFKDQSILQQTFLLFLNGRELLHSLVLTTMFEHPGLQVILILLLNIAMIYYLIQKTPFKSKLDAFQQFFFEVIALTVNVSVIIMALLSSAKSKRSDIMNNFGKFIIIMNMCFNFGTLSFMLLKLFEIVKESVKAYKVRQENKKKRTKLPLPVLSLQPLKMTSQRKKFQERGFSKLEASNINSILELDSTDTLKITDIETSSKNYFLNNKIRPDFESSPFPSEMNFYGNKFSNHLQNQDPIFSDDPFSLPNKFNTRKRIVRREISLRGRNLTKRFGVSHRMKNNRINGISVDVNKFEK